MFANDFLTIPFAPFVPSGFLLRTAVLFAIALTVFAVVTIRTEYRDFVEYYTAPGLPATWY